MELQGLLSPRAGCSLVGLGSQNGAMLPLLSAWGVWGTQRGLPLRSNAIAQSPGSSLRLSLCPQVSRNIPLVGLDGSMVGM